MSLPGFEDARWSIGEADCFVTTGGAGPPLLLLHGFPQTYLCWEAVAPRLARDFAVVAPDLRGYGASRAPAGGPQGEGYAKREMACDLTTAQVSGGHFLPEEEPEELGERLSDFLRRGDP